MLAGIFVWALALLSAADWPQFRGPQGMGLSSDKNLPVELGKEKNVVWKTEVPPGHSSPIFLGSRIFLTAYDGDALVTLCLDRASGKQQWRREAPRPRKEVFQKTNSPASPTPFSDGSMVYVFFGDYGILAYGLDGDEKWKLPLGPFNNVNGHGSSPIVEDGILVLICDQDTGSYLLALDAKTGKQRWRVERPEVTRGYATPGIYQPKPGAPKELIIPGAYQLISYDLKTGDKLWWANGMAWQLKCVPVIEDGIIYINSWETGGDFENAPQIDTWPELKAKYDKNKDDKVTPDEAPADMQRWFQNNDLNFNNAIEERDWTFWILHRTAQNSVLAIKPDGGRGDLTSRILWRYRKSLPNVPSPLLYQDTLFLVKDGGILTTLKPQTGEVQKQGRLTGAIEQYWASPVGGDGKVYLVSQACKVTVVKATGEWEILHMSDLEDDCFATPALLDGGLYLRTKSTLYFFKNAR
ncbi:MAG: PQQ-binding-like beta-propeller repeat protein [Bryobacterales bacterium]|nr:PQQ-binding-like beta-propeller repeat protein [Bryobacterales bacterium]